MNQGRVYKKVHRTMGLLVLVRGNILNGLQDIETMKIFQYL